MKIRRAKNTGKNTVCRTCHDDLRAEHFPPSTYNLDYKSAEYTNRRNAWAKDVEDRDSFNKDKLWVLNASTASGSGNEVICTKHLQELKEKIDDALKGEPQCQSSLRQTANEQSPQECWQELIT